MASEVLRPSTRVKPNYLTRINMRVLIEVVVCILGVVYATDVVNPLRHTLHGTLARVAPTTIKEAVVVSLSEGASHFQKLPGELLNLNLNLGLVD